jgi:hypothetical protein
MSCKKNVPGVRAIFRVWQYCASKKRAQAGGVAQAVEYLFFKGEALSSNTHATKNSISKNEFSFN